MDSGLCTTAAQKICINLQLLLEEANHEIRGTDAGRAWGKSWCFQVNQRLLCLEVTGKKIVGVAFVKRVILHLPCHALRA